MRRKPITDVTLRRESKRGRPDMTREEMDRKAKECLSSLPSSLSVKDRMAIEHQEMPSQDAKERIHNMDEVALGYSEDMAVLEASRCLNCKNKPCVSGCPVSIDIPAFISAFFQASAAVYARRNHSARSTARLERH